MKRRIVGWWNDGQWNEDWREERRSADVIEPDREPQFTGLYDQHGNPLMSIEEPNPIGFFARIECDDD